MILSREEILALLQDRMQYYGGGEELKSMFESSCDSRLVAELRAIRNAADGHTIVGPEGFFDSLKRIVKQPVVQPNRT